MFALVQKPSQRTKELLKTSCPLPILLCTISTVLRMLISHSGDSVIPKLYEGRLLSEKTLLRRGERSRASREYHLGRMYKTLKHLLNIEQTKTSRLRFLGTIATGFTAYPDTPNIQKFPQSALQLYEKLL